jgi:hypothetical protein
VVTGLSTEAPGYWVYQCSSPSEYVCVGAEVPEGLALIVDVQTEGDEVGRHILTRGLSGNYGPTFGYAETGTGATGFLASDWRVGTCVTVTLRDQAGREGPPRELCADDIPVFTPATLTSISCSNGTIEYEGMEAPSEETPNGETPGEPTPGDDDEPPRENGGEDDPQVLRGVDTTQPSDGGCNVAAGGRQGSGSVAALLLLALLCAGVTRRARRVAAEPIRDSLSGRGD